MELVVLTIDEVELACLTIGRDIRTGQCTNPSLYLLNWLHDTTWKRTNRLDVRYFNEIAKAAQSNWRVKFNPR